MTKTQAVDVPPPNNKLYDKNKWMSRIPLNYYYD